MNRIYYGMSNSLRFWRDWFEWFGSHWNWPSHIIHLCLSDVYNCCESSLRPLHPQKCSIWLWWLGKLLKYTNLNDMLTRALRTSVACQAFLMEAAFMRQFGQAVKGYTWSPATLREAEMFKLFLIVAARPNWCKDILPFIITAAAARTEYLVSIKSV